MMNNKGSVLIFVLIFIAFCASMVILLYEKSMTNMEHVAEDFYEDQANIYAMSALTAVEKILSDDDNAFDSRFEDWAAIPPTPVPYGNVNISVRPANSKIDLNFLSDMTKSEGVLTNDSCVRIFTEENIKTVTCAEIADFIDTNAETANGGREDAEYEFNGITFRTKNAVLDTAAEIRLLFSDAGEYQRIKKYFTASPKPESLNINFADADTLKMYLPELADYADKIEDYAESDEFKDISVLRSELKLPEDLYIRVLPNLSVKSSLFYVKTEVTLNGKQFYYHGLINKNGTNTKVIRFLAGIDGQYY